MKLCSGFSTRVREHWVADPAALALVFLEHGETETLRWTRAELELRVARVAAGLLAAGLRGQRALLLHPPGPDFAVALCACLRAGVVAVPVPDPAVPRHLPRILAIGAAARPAAVLGIAVQESLGAGGVLAGLPACRFLATDRLAAAPVDPPAMLPAEDPAAPALLQFTSGATQAPRGVVLTQDNLAANLSMIHAAFGIGPPGADTSVSWLPPWHDMGLVGGLLAPFAFGVPAILMPPLAFMQKPERWPAAISRYGATISGGPDFAYALCADRIRPERIAGLDLRRWRVAFCGAERVRPTTLARFAARFAPAGLDPDAFLPCYGLAEATLLVTGGPAGGGVQAAAGGEVARCGVGWREQTLRVVDPDTATPVAPGATGEIWVAGPHVAAGYFEDAAATAETFGARIPGEAAGPFLRTGDIGRIEDGQLTVLGRMRNLIVVRGAKHHAEDVEATAAAVHPLLAAAAAAAFAVEGEAEEELVVLQELPRGRAALAPAEAAPLAAAVLQAVTEAHGLRPREVRLVAPWSLPRTTSGKVRRAACREAYLSGGLPALAVAVPPTRRAGVAR